MMAFTVVPTLFVLTVFMLRVRAHHGGIGNVNPRVKPGLCPTFDTAAECPDEVENYCTLGDDSTCAAELKCCDTGCEAHCLPPVLQPSPPPQKSPGIIGAGDSRIKPGVCPTFEFTECPEEVDNYCTFGDDSTCTAELKCCYTACEADCLSPVLHVQPSPPPQKNPWTSKIKPGLCPTFEVTECPDEVDNYCALGDDTTCAAELKCCYTGCEYDCFPPDPQPSPPSQKIIRPTDSTQKQEFNFNKSPLSKLFRIPVGEEKTELESGNQSSENETINM